MATKTLADLSINLEGTSDKLANELSVAARRLEKFAQEVDGINRLAKGDASGGQAFKGITEGADAAKKSVSALEIAAKGVILNSLAGAFSSLTGSVGGLLKASGDFEKSMNFVSVRSKATDADFEKLRATAIQLGKDTSFSAGQAADGMKVFAAAGNDATHIIAVMPGVLSLAAAGMISVEKAADITLSTLHQFNLGVEESGKIADILTVATNKTHVSMDELGESLKYTGPVAKALGLNLEDTVAATVLLARAGIKGSESGTALRGSLTRLIAPTTAAQKVLTELGISTVDSFGKMKRFDDIVSQFARSKATFKDIVKVVKIEASSAFTSLVQSVREAPEVLNDLRQAMVNVTGESGRTSAGLLKGLNGAIEVMNGSIETASIALGDNLSPAAQKVIGVITDLLNVITDLANGFKTLPESVKNATLAIVAIGAGVISAAASLRLLQIGIGVITISSTAMTAGIAALGAGLLAFVATNETTSSAIGAAWGAITGTFTGAIDLIGSTIEGAKGLGSDVVTIWEEVSKSVSEAFNANILPTIETVISAFSRMGSFIVESVRPAYEFLEEGTTRVSQKIGEEWSRTIDQLVTAFSTASNYISSAIGSLVDKIISKIEAVQNALYNLTSKIPGISLVDGAIDGLANGIERRQKERLSKAGESGADAYRESFAAALKEAGGLFQGDKTLERLDQLKNLQNGFVSKPSRESDLSAPPSEYGPKPNRKAEAAAKRVAGQVEKANQAIEKTAYNLGLVKDTLAEKIEGLLKSGDLGEIQKIGESMSKSSAGANQFSISLGRANDNLKKAQKETDGLGKRAEAAGTAIEASFKDAEEKGLDPLAEKIKDLIKAGDKEGLYNLSNSFSTSKERTKEFSEALQDANADLRSLRDQAKSFGAEFSSAISAGLGVFGVNSSDSGNIGGLLGSLFSGEKQSGLGGELASQLGDLFGGKDGLKGISEEISNTLGVSLTELTQYAAVAGDTFESLFRKIGKDKKGSIEGGSQVAGTIIGSIFGQPQLGSEGGKIFGRLLSRIVGAGVTNPDTLARKSIEKYLEDLFTGVKAQFLGSNGKFQLFDGNFLFGDIERFNNQDWTSGFDKFSDGAKTTFSALGDGLRRLQGITEDVGGQIGLILAEQFGGNIDNARFLVDRLGVSLEDFQAKFLEAGLAGEISWHDYNVQIQGISAAFEEGISAVGAYDQAFSNLIQTGGRGSEAIKSFKDIAVEALESGIKSMDEVRQNLIAKGADPKEVEALFQAAAQRGIKDLEAWKGASKETAGAIVGDMYALSGALATKWDQMSKTLSDVQTAINSIPDKQEKSVSFKVEVDDPSGILDSLSTTDTVAAISSQSKIKKFAMGGVFDSPTTFGSGRSLGVLGEAGPEAILPLTRRNGVLGVRATGGGASSQTAYHIDARGAAPGVSNEILRALEIVEQRAVNRSVETIYEMQRRGF